MYDFTNKVAMVTGGASGIGKATVLRFAGAGAKVAVVDIDNTAGKALVNEINRTGGTSVYFDCDITDEKMVSSLIQSIMDEWGRLDYAFNNAGVGGEFANIENYPANDWDKVMAINLKAVFLCMKYQIPRIKKQGGAIVNTASVLSTVAYENDSAYVASKFAVLGLTKNAALEYAGSGIRINAISPGFTRTPMIDKGDEKKLARIAARHPIGRLADPDEMAKGVLWLCSDESSFAVGLNLLMDGGYTLQ